MSITIGERWLCTVSKVLLVTSILVESFVCFSIDSKLEERRLLVNVFESRVMASADSTPC